MLVKEGGMVSISNVAVIVAPWFPAGSTAYTAAGGYKKKGNQRRHISRRAQPSGWKLRKRRLALPANR